MTGLPYSVPYQQTQTRAEASQLLNGGRNGDGMGPPSRWRFPAWPPSAKSRHVSAYTLNPSPQNSQA